MEKIQTYVFFDLETSGSYGSKERILELAMVAVSRDDLFKMKSHSLLSGKIDPPTLPRVVHKYTRLYYPKVFIHPNTEEVHGLDNYSLEHLTSFNKSSAESIVLFLDLPPPVCMLAHNGNSYDFPILKAELIKANSDLPENILCVDTLICTRILEDKVEEVFGNRIQNKVMEVKNDESVSFHTPQSSVKQKSNTNNQNVNGTSVNNVDKVSVDCNKKILASREVHKDKNRSLKYEELSEMDKREVDTSMKIWESFVDSDEDELPVVVEKKFIDLSMPTTSALNGNMYRTPEKSIHTSNVAEPKPPNKKNVSAETLKHSSVGREAKKGVKRALNYSVDGSCKKYKTPFSQPILYQRLFGSGYHAHRAESDAKALMKICSFYGQDFLDWADQNFTHFKDVKPKWSHRKCFSLNK